MGLFKKKLPPPPEACPACGDLLSSGHCEVHTRDVAGGFIFECACGVSTMKWPSSGTAAMCMELHLDHDHNTHVSQFGNDRTTLGMLYRDSFPRGAVQPHQEPPSVNVPRRGDSFTLTSGQQLVAIIGQDHIPATWDELAQQIAAASGEQGEDAAYLALVGLFQVMQVAWSDVLSDSRTPDTGA